ncbi:methyltransferase [Leifsonia sp. Root227]|uniref:class I SAM-dependent DNA methyltransferase n=1 Tax=unclassified Leifsonia TaxID=2663824 RepID=UPI0006FE8978|nr:class I SAM-dependent methyltransferase [Leifsonia sp. Root227]KRC52031.1 methyltransferase [Leifsonia sp. Root227]
MTEHPDVVATRAAYDAVAVDYAALLRDELAGKALDRAMLAAFAEHVQTAGGGEVADLGCGPGRVTVHLAGLGLDAFGVDLSPAMVEVARETYPELLFEVGTMAALELPDAALAGAVAWYSIIHTPRERQHILFAEFARVVRPGGWLLLAFQVGDDVVSLRHAYGHDLELDAYRQDPDRIHELLAASGFTEHARLVREPVAPEKVQQAYVLARH